MSGFVPRRFPPQPIQSYPARHAKANNPSDSGKYNSVNKKRRLAEPRLPSRQNRHDKATVTKPSDSPPASHQIPANPPAHGQTASNVSASANHVAKAPLRRPLSSPFDHMQ